jgi:energy-coupling factor transport system permease protein
METRETAMAARTGFLRDPLTRTATVACISLGTLSRSPSWYVAAAAGAYFLWSLGAGLPAAALVARARGALLFLCLIVFLNAVTVSGRVVLEAGGVYLTSEGLARGAAQALRLCVVMWGALLLVSGARIEEFQDAAERFSRLKGRPLLAAGTIAITYLPLLVESARRVANARRARGEEESLRFPGGFIRAASGALPLFSAAIRNADALAEAMEARCYEPSSPRTPFRPFTVSPVDAAIVAAVLLVSGTSLAVAALT